MMATIAEVSRGVDLGQVSFSQLMEHVKAGDFTLEDFNAFQERDKKVRLDKMVEDFYNGELFRAQYNNFVDWCDGVHAYHDRQQVEQYTALEAVVGKGPQEIRDFITQLVKPKMKARHKILAEDPVNLKKILTEYDRRIDAGGWRTWPKQRPA